ncbi:hypothetical protein CC1G_13051 [Coprinopsis cinerea okayama7|uniref:Uncharacterized protein n=1 Tax=Coprinopsis cinerea (strain Okayama-7 / 130 / ATCC MYA-4618 / FGSC 9003) TaxID=240176 RepID=A8PB11_COPC7|nr:hypothetical protein CC1G_13051 [Coprinopsis cinerea okayama7\|eukprot:XP_001840086.1 hypothetical protein CC1G_13051 [Coprinopsis cinerea okayama7\
MPFSQVQALPIFHNGILSCIDPTILEESDVHPSALVDTIRAYKNPLGPLRLVCRSWNDAITRHSPMASRLIIHLDRTSFDNLRLYVEATVEHAVCSDRPLDLYILLKSKYLPTTFNLGERKTLMAILGAVHPYCELFRTLFIEVSQSSSIPPYTAHYLAGNLSSLKHFALVYHADDSGLPSFSDIDDAQVRWPWQTGRTHPYPVIQPFVDPGSLTEVMLGGRELMRMVLTTPLQVLTHGLANLRSAGVHRLTATTEGYTDGSFHSWLGILGGLNHLIKVSFLETFLPHRPPSSIQQRIHFACDPLLVGVGLNACSINHILGAVNINPRKLVLAKCAFDTLVHLPLTPIVEFHEVYYFPNLSLSILPFSGHEMRFVHCQGVTGEFFEELVSQINKDSAEMWFRGLKVLAFERCGDLPIGALLRFLTCREKALTDAGKRREEVKLGRLEVTGGSPKLLRNKAENALSLAMEIHWNAFD